MAKRECRWSCPEDWSQWSAWLAAGLHARNRWRLPVLLTGILFGLAVGMFLAYLVAASMDKHYLEIMLPGSVLGAIVGFATQKYPTGETKKYA